MLAQNVKNAAEIGGGGGALGLELVQKKPALLGLKKHGKEHRDMQKSHDSRRFCTEGWGSILTPPPH